MDDLSARQRPVYQTRNSLEEADVERGNSLPSYSDANDPYSLRHGLKTDQDIDEIRANTSRKRVIKGNRVLKFYKRQNSNIERLLKPVDEHVRDASPFSQSRYRLPCSPSVS